MDFIGVMVTSSKPVAMFSGNKYTKVPPLNTIPFLSKEHLCVQVPPINLLGNELYTYTYVAFCKNFLEIYVDMNSV